MKAQQTLTIETTSSFDKKLSDPYVEQFINETIDDVLSSLSAVCTQAVYDYLEIRFRLGKSDLANHTKEFSEALREIFGEAAALLEIQIMKELYRKVPQFKHRPEGTVTLSGYVDALNSYIRK